MTDRSPPRIEAEAPPTPPTQTAVWAPWVYGEDDVPLDDPAELYHEASATSPNVVDHRVPGPRLLERQERLQASTVRAVKRHTHLPAVPLPAPALPSVPFGQVVSGRKSERVFGSAPISLEHVATLLQTSYGLTHSFGEVHPLRAVPSGGALYPLEVYLVPARVQALDRAIYHFDPLAGRLERIRELEEDPSPLPGLTVYPELFGSGAVVFFVTAVFWRTRFKYGQRGYRFALIEAGHLGQNLLLTAEALGLAAVAVGGFYDRLVNDFLGVDAVNEAAVYAFSVGRRPDRP